MNDERLGRLTDFLADLESPAINISEARPMPRTGDVFVANILLYAVTDKVGKHDPLAIAEIVRREFSKLPLLEGQIDTIWDLYGSDAAFFAHLETLLAARQM